MIDKTSGELLFEDYLATLALVAEFEPPIGRTRPDYLVHASVGDVLCEIEDFGEGQIDRMIQDSLASMGTWAGPIDPYGRIREKLEVAAHQLREFKARYACVAILHNPGYMVDLSNMIVQGAMYGDIAVQIGIDPAGNRPPVDRGLKFTPRTAKLRRSQNTTLSAVAILELIRPYRYILDGALSSYEREHPEVFRNPSQGEIKETLDLIEAVKREHPEVDIEIPRLRIFHNFHAVKQLDVSTFAGLYDEQFTLDSETQSFRRISGAGS